MSHIEISLRLSDATTKEVSDFCEEVSDRGGYLDKLQVVAIHGQHDGVTYKLVWHKEL